MHRFLFYLYTHILLLCFLFPVPPPSSSSSSLPPLLLLLLLLSSRVRCVFLPFREETESDGVAGGPREGSGGISPRSTFFSPECGVVTFARGVTIETLEMFLPVPARTLSLESSSSLGISVPFERERERERDSRSSTVNNVNFPELTRGSEPMR